MPETGVFFVCMRVCVCVFCVGVCMCVSIPSKPSQKSRIALIVTVRKTITDEMAVCPIVTECSMVSQLHCRKSTASEKKGSPCVTKSR